MKKIPTPFLSRIGLAALLPMLIIAPQAKADAEDTFLVTAGVSVLHDDNVFRKPPGAAEADVVSVSTLGIKVDKAYSLQRFELDATLADHRYQTHDKNNFTALDYVAAWRWSLTPFFHGNLSSARTEVSNNTYLTPQAGTHTEERQRLDGVLEVSGSWRVLGGVTRSTLTNSNPSSAESTLPNNNASGSDGDGRLHSAEAGLRYDFPSGSSLSYIARESRGNETIQVEPNRGTLRFSQHEDELHLIWPITAKSTIDARAAYLARTYADDDARDYDGMIGNVNVNWQITGKTSLTAGVARELSGYQSDDSRFKTNRFTLSPLWKMSEKTGLRGRYDYIWRDYRGGSIDHLDKQRTALIALEWKALRTLTVSASLQHDRRSSNQPSLDFKSTQAGIAAQLAF